MLDTATLALEVTANTFINFLRKNFHITEEAAYGYICAKRRNHAYGNTNSKIDKAVKKYIYGYKHYFSFVLKNMRILFSDKTGYIYFILSFHFNGFIPSDMRNSNNPYQLFNGTDEHIDTFRRNFFYLVFPLFLDCCSKDELEFYTEFNNARLWRIDYSFNFQVPEALVPLYLHQFNGSVIEKNRLKKTTKFKYNSVHLHNKSISVVIYDKHAEVINNNRPSPDSARGMLRYEVRLRKAKTITNLKDTAKLNNTDLLKRDFAINMLLKYWDLLLPTGDFYKGTAANKKIRDELSPRQANKIIKFLKMIQEKHSVNTARKANTCTIKTFDSNLTTLNTIDIAPYLIPINKCRDYGVSTLINPYKQMIA